MKNGKHMIWDDNSIIWFKHGHFHNSDGPTYVKFDIPILVWYYLDKKIQIDESIMLNFLLHSQQEPICIKVNKPK